MKKPPKEMEEKFIHEIKENEKRSHSGTSTVGVWGKTFFLRHCKKRMILLKAFHRDDRGVWGVTNYYGCMLCGSIIRGKSDFDESGNYVGSLWERFKEKLSEIHENWVTSIVDRPKTEEWLEHAKAIGATHLIVVFDSAELDSMPIYVMPNENAEELATIYKKVPFASATIYPVHEKKT